MRIALNIKNKIDEAFVLSILDALQKKEIIDIQTNFDINPLTIQELNNKIEQSEQSKSFTANEAKEMIEQW